jgi:hypothetical protein
MALEGASNGDFLVLHQSIAYYKVHWTHNIPFPHAFEMPNFCAVAVVGPAQKFTRRKENVRRGSKEIG